MNMDGGPTQGFEKLQFLLQQNPFPHETFGNLLLLYLKYEYYDLAADVLAENAHLTYKFLTPVSVHRVIAAVYWETSLIVRKVSFENGTYLKYPVLQMRFTWTLQKKRFNTIISLKKKTLRYAHNDSSEAVSSCWYKLCYLIFVLTWLEFIPFLQYLYDFIEAVITRQTSPEEAYRKLDEMASKQTELLRKLTKQVQESRLNHDDDAVKRAVNDYDDALERWDHLSLSSLWTVIL